MTIATKDSSAPPTLANALISAMGYFTVAIACTWAGYALRRHSILITRVDLPLLAVAVAALLPAYVNRGILYELKHARFNEEDHNRRWLKKFSIQLSMLVGIGIALGAIDVYSRWTYAYNPTRAALQIIITMAPIYAINFRLNRRWLRDDSLYVFRFRSFFPAFATCLMPFTFGYSDFSHISCTAVAAVLILGYWVIALHSSTRTTALVGASLLLLVVIWQGTTIGLSTFQAECAHVLFFGTVMTLLMGVSEAWRVTTRVLNNQDLRSSPYSQREKNFHLGGTNLATALFIPFFLLTFLHPSTTGLYLLLFLFLLAGQYVSWFIDRTPTKSTLWPSVGVGSGLLVPIMIGVCAYFARNFEFFKFKSVPNELGPLVEVIGADLGLASFLAVRCVHQIVKERKNFPSESRLISFLTPYPCICLTGILSAFFSSAIMIYGVSANFAASTEARLANLIAVYTLITLACALAITINYFSTKMSDHSERPQKSSAYVEDPDKGLEHRFAMGALKQVNAMCGLTRPIPSLTAGILTLIIAQRGGNFVAIRAGITMTLIVMFGFIIDNIYDFKADCRAGIRTPLTLGLVSESYSRRIAAFVAAIAIVINPHLRSLGVVVVPTLLALTIYPWFSTVLPRLKGFYTATLVCVPLFYPSLITGSRIPVYYYVILFVFIVAREAFIDTRQLDADLKAGNRTCAVVWNAEVIKIWSERLMCLATSLLVIMVSGEPAKALATLAMFSVVVILYSSLIKQRHAGWLRMPMILGAVSIALSVS
jgi:hypothetical protein